jgi:hypothetical protein
MESPNSVASCVEKLDDTASPAAPAHRFHLPRPPPRAAFKRSNPSPLSWSTPFFLLRPVPPLSYRAAAVELPWNATRPTSKPPVTAPSSAPTSGAPQTSLPVPSAAPPLHRHRSSPTARTPPVTPTPACRHLFPTANLLRCREPPPPRWAPPPPMPQIGTLTSRASSLAPPSPATHHRSAGFGRRGACRRGTGGAPLLHLGPKGWDGPGLSDPDGPSTVEGSRMNSVACYFFLWINSILSKPNSNF